MVGHDGHRGWVYYLAVKPANREGGVGRRLMQEAENWLRERDVVKLNLMVRHSNAEARSFFQRLGYEDAEVTVLARWLVEPVISASQSCHPLRDTTEARPVESVMTRVGGAGPAALLRRCGPARARRG